MESEHFMPAATLHTYYARYYTLTRGKSRHKSQFSTGEVVRAMSTHIIALDV